MASPPVKKRKVDLLLTDPVLKDVIPHKQWQQIQRYRICLYGTRDLLQKGDIILTNQKERGLVDYFTQTEDRIVTIHLWKVKLPEELPDK